MKIMTSSIALFPTVVEEHDLSKVVDLDSLITEALTFSTLREEDQIGRYKIEFSDAPKMQNLVESVIQPLITDYIGNHFGYIVGESSTESSIVKVENGVGMAPHYHYGMVPASSCFYLTDSDADLALMDPRGGGMAAFQYPKQIRDAYFGEYLIKPKQAHLVIFPGYLHHYVKATGVNEFRLSLFTDYFILDK